ncbi:GNAT family acetyltransferase [Lactococcus formosensis]|uniref:GNAT family acetyltransferase n=1 Tax=Lactococcus formosensis TaxID=1281486 RepID=UPI002434F8DF|nr:GNAT family acetyltransferase [Lactococcus formosensis]MDG6125085.1 GNAT family acetyltransferase [Lactococcus formosensis]MDG6148783.1 GNAT family acetyltransferase [Lactococcus formosensis]
MQSKVIALSLSDLIEQWEPEEIETFLGSFTNHGLNHDIEYFLKHTSIQFEKNNISRTTLLIKNNQIIGYFSIANKPLIIEKSSWELLSNSLKRKLMPGFNIKNIVPPVYPQAILIGQLGKNYECDPLIEGNELLALAEAQVFKAQKYSGGRFVWLECDEQQKLIEFYTSNGYRLLGTTPTSQLLFIKKI